MPTRFPHVFFLLFLGVFLLLPSSALADAGYSGCDYYSAAGNVYGMSVSCPSPGVTGGPRQLYGVDVDVASLAGHAGPVKICVDSSGGVAYEVDGVSTPSGTPTELNTYTNISQFTAGQTNYIDVAAEHDFVFPNGSRPLVFASNGTSGCGGGQNNFTIYGQYAGPANTNMVWHWSPPTPPEASTEFNEIIEYVYEPNLDNSFGTSTIGVRFGIPEPTFIDSIGAELRGPLGNVVWSATSTADNDADYLLFDDYYFDETGVYELMGYFVQDGQRINNPSGLFITINTPEWSYDPVTGDLVPTASTTISTSTLTNFKVECPDDLLVGSLCKLAVGLFIPKVSSIQSLQMSFNVLMDKAPFSFFTQSKTVLDAFKVGTATTGGALALTLYGSEIDVVSSTTAASLGVDSGVIDFLKGIMVVGLWLMLAWYLYWRIASIFGV